MQRNNAMQSGLMNTIDAVDAFSLEDRARQSKGISNTAIYQMVARALADRLASGTLVDVGCGAGNLREFVHEQINEYIGVDAVRYDGFPVDLPFYQADLNACPTLLSDACADVVVAVETIEHLENPRAFMRELTRLAKPAGWIVVTTPNQLSILSLLTLMIKGRFAAFQDVHYPAHLTALLEVDLRRIAAECELKDVEMRYSGEGRIVLTPYHFPQFLVRCLPCALSDNVLLIGRKRIA